jgi:hypothetical protein
MPTFWNASVRADYYRRVARLTPDAEPRWGKFTAAGMVAHLNDAMRMATGELRVEPKRGPLRVFPLKQLILYVLPFPKGAPTAPELLSRCGAADLRIEQTEFLAISERAALRNPTDPSPAHPAFGRMSYDAWGKLIAKHTEHHLRQFGI